MTTTFEQANESLRQAVKQRREAQAAGKPADEWYGGDTNPMPEDPPAEVSYRGPSAAEVLERFAPTRPGSLAFLELLEELRQLHIEKTAQYGGTSDPFENVTASAKCGVEPWRRALCDLSDCVVRMQKFANGQPVDYENALMDAANWALICLLKLRESRA